MKLFFLDMMFMFVAGASTGMIIESQECTKAEALIGIILGGCGYLLIQITYRYYRDKDEE